MKNSQITNQQQEQLLAIDIQHKMPTGFTFGFAILMEKKGIAADKIVSEILNTVKPNRSLNMQLFGVAHNLQHA